MICKKCKSTNLQVIESGPHKKLTCADCFAFVKFLSKAEYKTFRSLNAQPADAVGRATQGPLSPEVAKEMIDGLDKAFGLK